jgi:ERF superfamily
MSDNIPVVSGFSTSSTIGELTKALALAHKEFKPVLKDANNPFFKSKYADLAGVIESTSDALSAHELVVIQSPGRIYNGHILLTTLLSHSSGEWIKDELELPIAKFDAQGTGSAITYARRYAYQAIVGVAAEDDDGNSASGKFEKQPDGSFARKSTENVQIGSTLAVPNPPVEVPNSGKIAEPAKPATRKKKESVPDAGKPWAGQFEPKIFNTPPGAMPESVSVSIQSNAITPENPITDADVLFPGDPEPAIHETTNPAKEVPRIPTDAERKAFMDRLIVLKNKGYSGIREYLLKESGETITNNIPFLKMAELVARLEQQEKNGDLKALLETK